MMFVVTSPDGKHTNEVSEGDAELFRAKEGWTVEEATATPKKPQTSKTQAPKKTTPKK